MTNEKTIKSFISAYESYIQKGGWRNSASIISHSHLIITGSTSEERMELIRSMYNSLYLSGVLNKMGITIVYADELNGKTEDDIMSYIREQVSEATDGVLLIENANKLSLFALDCVVRQIENNKDKLLFILAGNNPQMNDFMKANPAISRRFLYYLDLEGSNVQEGMNP